MPLGDLLLRSSTKNSVLGGLVEGPMAHMGLVYGQPYSMKVKTSKNGWNSVWEKATGFCFGTMRSVG